MRNHRVLRLGFRLRTAALLSACAALPQVLGCSDESASRRSPLPGAAPPHAAPAGARARIAAIRARFAGTLSPSPVKVVAPTPAGALRAAAPDAAVSVELPPRAGGPVRLADAASRVAIAFSLPEAADVPAAVDGGLVLYPGALRPGDGSARDVLHRVLPNGTEDFVHFDQEPERKELRYRVDVSAVSGLRLVERTLEFLDADGSPRLRVAPPYLVDATGARLPASLSVDGCAVDTSPRAPWGRPVTPPGAPECTVVIAWQPTGVQYPALLDPQWIATANQMIAPRTGHTATVIDPANPASPVLLAGGFDASGAALRTAELYFPLDRTFASTDAMDEARGAHSATAVTKPAPPGPPAPAPPPAAVVVVGGSDRDGGAPIATIEVYNPATGRFVRDPGSPLGRFNHSATLLGPGVVLVAGGLSDPLNQPTDTAFLYTFSGFGPNGGAPVTSALADVENGMLTARHAHTAVRLKAGNVLVAGGFVLSGAALVSAEIFDEASRTFQEISVISSSAKRMTAQMNALRGFHTATLLDRSSTLSGHAATSLDSGEVLLIGGTTRVSGGAYVRTVDIYHDGVTDPTRRGFELQPTPISMTSARARHTASLLPTGNVLVAGGFNGVTTLSSAEVYDPLTTSFSPLLLSDDSLPQEARREHAAVLVNAGAEGGAGRAVLVAGGVGSSDQVLASAQLLIKPNGDPCAADQECASGHCSEREHVCCNEACDQECFSCTASGKGTGKDGTCGPAKLDTELPIVCVNQIEVHNRCDGLGHAVAHQSTKDCKPGRCGSNNRCILYCLDDCDCDESGWCEVGEGDPNACAQPAGTGGASPGTGGGGAGGDAGAAGGGGASTGTGGAGAGTGGASGGTAGAGGGTAGAGGASAGSSSSEASAGAGGASAGSSSSEASAGAGGASAGAGGASAGSGGAPPGSGVCLDRLANGAACTRDRQCESGHCVDGFCCDFRCDGQCQACDVVNNIGKCTPVGTELHPEAPHPNEGGSFRREACPGEGACAGYCSGAKEATCTFPADGEAARTSTCICPDEGCAVGPATLTRFICDGDGNEKTPVSERCGGKNGGFRCADESTCKTSCTSSADCIEDFICRDGACVDLEDTGPSCDGEHTLLVAGDKDEDCTPYSCPAGRGACARPCVSVKDCVAGAVCSTAGECVPPLDPPDVASCSCRVVGAPAERNDAPFSILLGAAAALAALRRSRQNW